MTKLIITRHGQSIANAEFRFAGHSDFDLSEIGHKQAELTAEYIAKKFKIDRIYSSDLLRAYNTALPTARRLGLEVIPTTALREIYAGKWEGMTTMDIAVEYERDLDLWKNDYAHSRCTGGESTAEVYERAYAAVCDIADKHDGETLMLSTHATMVRALCARALGLSADEVGQIPFTHNASINLFTYENGRLIPDEFNIIEHLGDTVTGVHKSFSK
jgi:broad specificity phosphatase PhoE